MKYRVTHTTEYYYGERVALCHNLVRLRPRQTDRQTVFESHLSITPEPAARRDRVDYFGNHATWVSVQEPHEVLTVKAVSVVHVTPYLMPDGRPPPARPPKAGPRQPAPRQPAQPAPPADPVTGGPPWERAVEWLDRCAERGLYALKQYAVDSAHASADDALADYARPSFPPGRPLVACVLDLTCRIYREFKFDSRATTIGTPALDVLRSRRGVCQDFAHLQIGCLRSLGLAARYVSGYLLTHPPPGRPRLVGCDASHAWVSAWVPDVGWVDFDPTNGVIPSDGHITLGWARDYDDVSPIRGVLTGGRRQSMYFGVDVEPLDSAGEPEPA